MWIKFKNWWKEFFNFYYCMQIVGLIIVYHIMAIHGITVPTLDFWIAMVGMTMYGVFAMLEASQEKDKSESPED